MIPRPALAAWLLGALLALPVPALAESQTVGTATGSIVGTVRDDTGAVLPKVRITLSGTAIMGRRTTSTAADGSYRITALQPGAYKLSFTLPDFTPIEHEVQVGLGFTATLDVGLKIATQSEQVTVAKRTSVLDRHSTAIAPTFDSQQLADLPGSRNMSALLATAHAVQMPTIDVGGGAGAVEGRRGAYGTSGGNRPMVEGISVQGIFNSGFMLDYGSFQEASVPTAAHGAEWPTHGVHLQVVTKSGGNQYRGALYADYENRRWQSTNVDESQIARGARSGGGVSPRDANRLWQYRDLNADIGGFILRDRLWWYSSIRDQDVSSRLVNFPVRPHETRLTNYGGKGTYRIGEGSTLVGYGQRGSNHQPNRLDPFGPSGDVLSSSTAINETEDSTADQRNTGWVWKGEWNAVIDDALLFEMRVGQFGTRQEWRPLSAAPRFEDTETLIVSGGNRDWRVNLRRDQLFGNLSYFKNGWAGTHDLRFGVEATHWIVGETWIFGYPGNILHTLKNGRPDQVHFFHTPSQSESGLWTFAAYASDSWRVKTRLTLTLGIRFDRYRVFLPAQQHPTGSPDAQHFAAVDNLIDWNVAVPRIGAVYDLSGAGKTLAKFTFAQYRVAPGASVGSNSNPNATVWWTRYAWNDLDGNGVWNAGEQGERPRARRGGAAIESLDPDLQLPVMNEVGAWIERQLAADVGMRTGVLWRREHQHFMRQNANQPFDAFTTPVGLRDPGPDGDPDTPDDGPPVAGFDLGPQFADLPPVNIVRNVPGSTSEYWTWEVAATRRGQRRWSLGGGFAYTWNRDQAANYSGQAVRNNAYPLTPNDLINAGPGGRHQFTTWNAKAYGTYEAPWDVRVSPVLRHQSGQPFGRTFSSTLSSGTVRVLAEPIGTRRMDNITILDVRVEKRFLLNQHRRIAAFVDVFNCFNANPEEDIVWSSGAAFLRPVRIVPPRIAGIGVRFDW